MNTPAEGKGLSKDQRAFLRHVLQDGPSEPQLTKGLRIPAAVHQLVALRLVEPLNRMSPGSPIYEITPAGRAALFARPVPR